MQHNFSRILQDVDAGEEVQILRRKQVVARIVPDSDTPERRFPEFVSRAREIFGEGNGMPAGDIVLADREERL